MRKFNPANHFFVVSTLLRYGHSAAEPVRSAFVFFLLSFADLDGYPRRAALKQAFSPMGSYSDRLVEAVNLASAKLLEKADYCYAVRCAAKRFENHNLGECVEG